jgi:hypothetical protein
MSLSGDDQMLGSKTKQKSARQRSRRWEKRAIGKLNANLL